MYASSAGANDNHSLPNYRVPNYRVPNVDNSTNDHILQHHHGFADNNVF
jgi:hypothetical protein